MSAPTGADGEIFTVTLSANGAYTFVDSHPDGFGAPTNDPQCVVVTSDSGTWTKDSEISLTLDCTLETQAITMCTTVSDNMAPTPTNNTGMCNKAAASYTLSGNTLVLDTLVLHRQ